MKEAQQPNNESGIADNAGRQDKSEGADQSHNGERLRLIPPHGGYRKLRSFQTAEVIYDGTAVFCNRFIDLTNQACYLLKRQLEKLEQAFLQEGGFTERLYAARQQHRSQMR